MSTLLILHGNRHVQSHLHHGGESGLALVGGGLHALQDMVGDGADAEASFAGAGGIQVQGGGLHLQSHDAHLVQAVDTGQTLGQVLQVIVEHIGGVDVAHMVGGAIGLGGLDGLAQQLPGSDGSEGTGQVEGVGEVTVGLIVLMIAFAIINPNF